jgi:UDP-glucose 4-epimerase
VKAIVFGGSGFLGSHVADCLTARGYTVTIFDVNLSPYLLPEQTMLEGDILDEEAVHAAIAGQDVVYNFAGIADLDDATTKPKLTVQLNVQGNLNIMEGCLRTPVRRFVYASTIYVYSQKGGKQHTVRVKVHI